jgi:hypothetical protein
MRTETIQLLWFASDGAAVLPPRDVSPKKTRRGKSWWTAVDRDHSLKPSGATGAEIAVDEDGLWDMTNLQRRLRKLEAQLTDSCGLVPHSQKWLEHWEQRISRMLTGEEPGTPGCIPLEVLDAVREAWEAEAVRAEVTAKDLAPVGG